MRSNAQSQGGLIPVVAGIVGTCAINRFHRSMVPVVGGTEWQAQSCPQSRCLLGQCLDLGVADAGGIGIESRNHSARRLIE